MSESRQHLVEVLRQTGLTEVAAEVLGGIQDVHVGDVHGGCGRGVVSPAWRVPGGAGVDVVSPWWSVCRVGGFLGDGGPGGFLGGERGLDLGDEVGGVEAGGVAEGVGDGVVDAAPS